MCARPCAPKIGRFFGWRGDPADRFRGPRFRGGVRGDGQALRGLARIVGSRAGQSLRVALQELAGALDAVHHLPQVRQLRQPVEKALASLVGARARSLEARVLLLGLVD